MGSLSQDASELVIIPFKVDRSLKSEWNVEVETNKGKNCE